MGKISLIRLFSVLILIAIVCLPILIGETGDDFFGNPFAYIFLSMIILSEVGTIFVYLNWKKNNNHSSGFERKFWVSSLAFNLFGISLFLSFVLTWKLSRPRNQSSQLLNDSLANPNTYKTDEHLMMEIENMKKEIEFLKSKQKEKNNEQNKNKGN